MKMQEVIAIGKRWSIPYRVGVSKVELIRAIQEKEGYTPCFRREAHCTQKECMWIDDCQTAK